MKRERLVEVRVFEPEDKLLKTPSRYRITNCWQDSRGRINNVGREGWWPFEGGKEECFLGWGEAEILGEIDISRANERDRFQAANPSQP